MSALIRADRISKSFDGNGGGVDAVRDVSFTVDDNEFVVLVGPSGCGKTTLLKTVAGIVTPTEGAVYLDGDPVRNPTSDVAMVFQDFMLLPWKTVVENVELGLAVQERRDEADCRAVAEAWIDKVGLGGFEHSYPNELSGGMKQRVGLARALAVDPDVLLMDEPFGSLDAQTKDVMQTELLELWDAEQKTVLYVTHDIDEAIYMADRILVLSETPASVRSELSVDIDRPRWGRRLEIERSDEFARIRAQLRRELGLSTDSSTRPVTTNRDR